jgi:hypothetical protein
MYLNGDAAVSMKVPEIGQSLAEKREEQLFGSRMLELVKRISH